MHEPLNVDWDGNELLLSDVLGTESDLELKDLEEEVDRHFTLPGDGETFLQGEKIMHLRFGWKTAVENAKEVAELLGISQSYLKAGKTYW